MNEYQEALEVIKETAYKQYEDACYRNTTKGLAMLYEQQLIKSAAILKKLVDKETPMKPRINILVDDWVTRVVHCGKCDKALGTKPFVDNSGDYCRYCGQKIDWGDE